VILAGAYLLTLTVTKGSLSSSASTMVRVKADLSTPLVSITVAGPAKVNPTQKLVLMGRIALNASSDAGGVPTRLLNATWTLDSGALLTVVSAGEGGRGVEPAGPLCFV
jgi:hypothetical protein